MFDYTKNRLSPISPVTGSFLPHGTLGLGGPAIMGALGLGSPVAHIGIPGMPLSAREVMYRCELMHIAPPMHILAEAMRQGYAPPNHNAFTLATGLAHLGVKR